MCRRFKSAPAQSFLTLTTSRGAAGKAIAMKHKTWFRLILKAIGVLTFVTGVSTLLTYSGFLWQTISAVGMGSNTSVFFFQLASPIVQIALGLYLFFGGEWVVNKAIPSNRPYCPECGYDLSGAVSSRCPECDTPFDPDMVRPSSLATADEDAYDDVDDAAAR